MRKKNKAPRKAKAMEKKGIKEEDDDNNDGGDIHHEDPKGNATTE
jgi:hypothetical protein